MESRREESGIIVVALLFLVVLIVFGFVVVNSISKSREAEQVRESAGDVIDSANELKADAEDLITN